MLKVCKSVYRKKPSFMQNVRILYSCNWKFTWRKCIMKCNIPSNPNYLPPFFVSPLVLRAFVLLAFVTSPLCPAPSWRRVFVLCASAASFLLLKIFTLLFDKAFLLNNSICLYVFFLALKSSTILRLVSELLVGLFSDAVNAGYREQ